MILPWFALSVLFIGVYSRVLRSTILDTVNEDYVRTARAKGLTERQVMLRHVLRNSLIPIISLWGLDFAAVIGGGAILTETVFNLHGVGQYAAQSVQALDIPPVLVITLFGAFVVVISARSSTSSTPCSTRGSGCERDRKRGYAPQHERAPARGPGPARCPSDRGRRRAGGRRRLVHRRARRGRGDRRRVGLGQVGDRDDADGADARPERTLRGRGPVRRPRAGRGHRRAAAQDPRAPDRDGLPGPDELAGPGLPGREQIVEQIRVHEPQDLQGAGARPRGRADGAGRDPARARPRCARIRTSSRAGCASA